MVAPLTIWTEWVPNGRTRHRRSFWGKMILQVEEERRTIRLLGPTHKEFGAASARWRDATWEDCVATGSQE